MTGKNFFNMQPWRLNELPGHMTLAQVSESFGSWLGYAPLGRFDLSKSLMAASLLARKSDRVDGKNTSLMFSKERSFLAMH